MPLHSTASRVKGSCIWLGFQRVSPLPSIVRSLILPCRLQATDTSSSTAKS
ncbi:hypothetical protein L249_0722 [Ophiocordyceps polyrhachis-furcata BCC 54312]|uniref:Uncharacterized protein n=1 Tax=Ophiocordyceps polyrhachis-furcata BCC 54312 TaxID=1330021 RepID=A0A367LED1_9HYPO|nr:hypothetical protein L249_0722 [Ophiocordyceps polyrhachis-furcata BCC 54312]